MVNASLNWASIVGIVLAVCGGGLYFLRSFKPALARDYDCLLYTSPSPRDAHESRMPSSA